MSTIEFNAEGTSLEDVTRNAEYYGLVKAAVNTPISSRMESAIRDSLPGSLRQQVRNGSMRIVPRETVTMRNGQDVIEGAEYDLARVERVREPVYTDPVFVITGPTAERTALFLKDMLEEQIRKDVIKYGLSDGVASRMFKVSVADLARLLQKDERQVYDECVQLLISGSVTTMKNAIVPSAQTKVEPKIPIAVR